MSKRQSVIAGPFTYARVVSILLAIVGVVFLGWAGKLELADSQLGDKYAQIQTQVAESQRKYEVTSEAIKGKVDGLEKDLGRVEKNLERVEKKVDEGLKEIKQGNEKNVEKLLEAIKERGRLR